MTTEQEQQVVRQISDIQAKLTEIHATIFGVEGQGGLHRRIEKLEGHRDEINIFKAKMLGAVTVASAVASFLGVKIAAILHL